MSLTLRLTLTYVLVTLAGLLLLGGAFITLAGRYTAQQRERELEVQAEIYAAFLAGLARSSAELQALAPGLAAGAVLPPDVTVRLFAPGGALLSDSAGLGPFPSRPALAYIVSPLPVPVSQAPNRRYVARPIPGPGGPLGVVEVSRSTIAEQQLQANLRTLVLQAALLAALAMILVSLLVARTIARPIVSLTRRAEALAAGAPPAAPAPTPARNEIALLGQSLDQMAGQLQARVAEAERERASLGAVLAAISEGVVALAADDTVVFANPAAATLLDAAPAELPARLAALDLPLHPVAPLEQEVMLGRRQLLVTISPVRDGAPPADPPAASPAVVLVVRDMTRLKDLEQARTRFFRSISHDLRTPLTAIRGMLENLRDTAPPDQQTALRTLEEESARLARLVDELLHPSANGALLLAERRRIDLGALAQELCALQQGRARRAGLRLACLAQPDLPPIYGDRDRLKQALLNLLDNALHVTPAGGAVSVAVEPDGAALLRLTVADSGPGVTPELRERIWERGVRGADLGAAGGDYGGAGLGLAIVREIVAAHGGRAWVEAHTPQGARFVLELPVAPRT